MTGVPKPAIATDSELFETRGNAVIAQLAAHERNAIHRMADVVRLVPGELLLRAHAVPNLIYFPIDAVASIVRRLSDGTGIELAMVGPEGLVGLDAFLESTAQLDDTVVLTRGTAYRIGAEELRNELRRGDGLQRQMLRVAGALNAQIAQTVVCTRFHEPLSRLARWLLMIHDRVPARTPIATAAIRTALALEQSQITSATKRLVTAGFVRAFDDAVCVIDADGLEATSCECYDVLRGRQMHV